MNEPWQSIDLPDLLNVGLSLVLWHPEEPDRSRWIWANKARCRMVGQTREEVLSQPPMARVTRETRSMLEMIRGQLLSTGRASVQSTLLHKSYRPVPVMMHLNLIERDDGDLLLTEFHDISVYKETEAQLTLAQDRTRNIMKMVSDEKRHISRNIRENLGLVAMPMIEQLKASASTEQLDLLDVLERRLRHVTRQLGIRLQAGPSDAGLTRRELLVCEMIRDGLSSKAIAAALGCSPSTVNNHRNAIRRKLGLAGSGTNLQTHLDRLAREAATTGEFADGELDRLI